MIGSVKLAPWAIIIVDTWMWTPYVMLICLAGCARSPDYIYEAAEVDRASRWRQFWSITLPMALPFIMLAVLFPRHRELQDVRHGQPAHFGRTGLDDRGGLDHA
jgi:ABC-type sugar transport system permease subunit